MSKFNDIDLERWRESDVNVESLWLIGARAKKGKHKNVYHGNFIPQIPNQLLSRYTKQGEVVLEPFKGSGTTSNMKSLVRKYICLDKLAFRVSRQIATLFTTWNRSEPKYRGRF